MKIIQIDGVIGWDVNGRDIRRQLQAAGGQAVRVEINSPGGFVIDGLEIFNRLRAYSGPVHTHIMSLAASMASYIALAGDKISAEDNAIYMIHNVWGFGIGDHRDLRAEADILEGLTGLLSKAYEDRTGKSNEEIRGLMDAETFLFGEEMLDAGFVDEITQGGEPTTKGSAVAVARTSLDSCVARLKEVGQTEEDQQKVAAMLGDINKTQNAAPPVGDEGDEPGDNPDNKTVDKGGESNQEDKMDLQKLKAEHPALYAQVLQEGEGIGRAGELDRVKGHLTMAKSSGAVDFAHECINEGKNLGDQTVIAGYMAAGLAKKNIDDTDADNVDDDLGNLDNQDEDATEKALLADVLDRSQKSGAAVKPEQEA